MSAIARGQITIVDLNDGRSINLFLSSNRPATQIFNKENSSYNPTYTASPYLTISPEVYVSGSADNQVAQLAAPPTWKINGSTDLSSFGATAATAPPYALTIKQNLTATSGTTLTSGMTSTTLTVNLWQNGAQLADSFFTGATCTWRKFNKLGVQDTSWGTSGIKTGRSITVTRDEISVAATFTVEISK